MGSFSSDDNIDKRLDDELASIYPFKIRFYYGARDYNYINNIFTYRHLTDITNTIQESKHKWLVFVSSSKKADDLIESITGEEANQVKNKKSTCEEFVFLSRDEKENNSIAKEVYDKLIINERFNSKILISTSLLDNGINIEDSEVTNIVIDTFDRTELIQMLGRIRVKDGGKLTLYICDYNIKDLKEIRIQKRDDLLYRLVNDLLPVEMKKEHFHKRFFYYTNNPDTFCDYNPCAIYQLIDTINCIIDLLRNAGTPFTDDSEAADKAKIYNYYKLQDEGNGKAWSRSIIDLLESADGELRRNAERKRDMQGGGFDDRYSYHFRDSFTRFVFSDLIPGYYIDKVEQLAKTEFLVRLNALDKFYKNRFNLFLQHNMGDTLEKVSYYEQLKYLSGFLEKYNLGLPINLDKLNEMIKKANESKAFSEKKMCDSVHEQLCWIEKPDFQPKHVESISAMPEKHQEANDTFNQWIEEHAVSEQEIEKARKPMQDGKPSKFIQYDFLQQHGIAGDSHNNAEFAQHFFGSDNLAHCKEKKVELKGKSYTLKSYSATKTGHQLFYVFIIDDSQSKQK